MHLSLDGLVRLSLDELLSVPIVHLISGIDCDEDHSTAACGRMTTISGYTEWVSQTQPAITIGWDWCVTPGDHEGRCRRVGPPRANIMLVDDRGADRPWFQNAEFLGTVVDVLPWVDLVPRELAGGASPPTR